MYYTSANYLFDQKNNQVQNLGIQLKTGIFFLLPNFRYISFPPHTFTYFRFCSPFFLCVLKQKVSLPNVKYLTCLSNGLLSIHNSFSIALPIFFRQQNHLRLAKAPLSVLCQNSKSGTRRVFGLTETFRRHFTRVKRFFKSFLFGFHIFFLYFFLFSSEWVSCMGIFPTLVHLKIFCQIFSLGV